MNAVELSALARLVPSAVASDARDDLEPGVYSVDLLVHVKGLLSVSEDTTKKPTSSIPVLEVLALLVARSGATRQATLELVRSCMADALAAGTSGQTAIAGTAEISEVWKAEVSRMIDTLPRVPVRGRVVTSFDVDLVEPPPSAAAAGPILLQAA